MKKSNFTLIELLIVISIIAILASFLLPALSSAREKGRTISCTNNLKQVGLSFSIYQHDHDGFFPNASSSTSSGGTCYWGGIMVNNNYISGASLICPNGKKGYYSEIITQNPLIDRMEWQRTDYRFNHQTLGPNKSPSSSKKIEQIRNSSAILLGGDTQDNSGWGFFSLEMHFSDSLGYGVVWPRHGGETSCNLLWVDGHCTAVKSSLRGKAGSNDLYKIIPNPCWWQIK